MGKITINIFRISAIITATLISGGSSPITAKGLYWSETSLNPTEKDYKIEHGSGRESFTETLTGLIPNSKYYIRSFATNSFGTAISSLTESFTTLPDKPIVLTSFILDFTKTTTVLGGNDIYQGLSAVTERGVYWGLSPDPEISGNKLQIGSGMGTFSTNLTGISPGTTYYVKAYAVNNYGIALGSQYSFNSGQSLDRPIVTDIDNNIYHFITIGNQTWLAENLQVTRYNDGSVIPLVTDSIKWLGLTTPGYCWYKNDASTYQKTYGALYNWYVVNAGKLCPEGWHVPTKSEWTLLTTYLGGEEKAGAKLKEAGAVHWTILSGGFTNISDSEATNETGFTALPGGSRFKGTFILVGENGYWWSSTEFPYLPLAFGVELWLNDGNRFHLGPDRAMQNGFSVRCLKDN
jgi:uncharacterized protein (TIGR02145 family)